MTSYNLNHTFDLLKKFLGEELRSFSMVLHNGCIQAKARSVPGKAFSLKRGETAWHIKIHGPRKLLLEFEGPSLKQLFTQLKAAIQEEKWCLEFEPLAASGEEAFSQ